MAQLSAVGLLVLLLVGVALVTAVLAARHRLAFRIAMRNVRRGRARTVLLVAGLLVGTTIISGSLVVGDTVQQLSLHYTYLGVGYTDEAIQGASPSGGFRFFPYDVYTQVASLVANHPSIAGVTPEIVATASALDRANGIPETNLNLLGANANQSTALGAFVADNGTTFTGAAPGQVLLDDQAALALNASVGDTLIVYGVAALPLTVEAVVQENLRGAFITAGLTPGNLFVDLATAQALEIASGQINYIAITNSGSQAAGADASAGVSAYLNATLAPILTTYGLAVDQPLENALNAARQSATNTETIFLVLGLFSILAGSLLIVGIFVMLAEERKGEMGMLRAIGLRRRELVYAFYFEGVTYAAGSALAGTVLGVGVGYFLAYLAGSVLQAQGLPRNAILESFTVSGQSLVIAYVVGFLLTLVTVVVAIRRASRLNIVRAIRDVPEPPPAVRTYTFLAYLGGGAFVLGLLLFLGTYRGSSDLSLPIIGGALVIAGLGLVAARFAKNRPVFTAVGLALVVWGGLVPLHTYLLGSDHTGGIFIVFVEGVIMVGGVLLAFLFNAPWISSAVARLLGRRSDSSPVVRIGLAYPARQPTRTAVSLTIFALVVFTMVATATFGSTLEANLANSVAEQSGGYSFFGVSQTPIPDLWDRIAANTTLAPLFASAVPLIDGAVDVNVSGYAGNPYRDTLYAAPANSSGPASLYDTNAFTFTATLDGMSASEAFRAVETTPTDVIVDQSYAPPTTSLSGSGPTGQHPTVTPGETMLLESLHGGPAVRVTVVGILTESLVTGVWTNPATAASLGFVNTTAYYLTVASGVSTTFAAQQAKKAFFPFGLVLFDLRGILATSISTTQGFIGLLEIFVGLGLAVGIAAMGILALRAVVERRREIGMLRATGFTQRAVLRTFLVEYSFVTLAGVIVGVALGLLIVFNLTQSASAASSGITEFAVPWANVALIAVVAYLLVVAAIAGPSIRAARLSPADAVRASE